LESVRYIRDDCFDERVNRVSRIKKTGIVRVIERGRRDPAKDKAFFSFSKRGKKRSNCEGFLSIF
jgi:hypothetical protein